MLSVQDLAGAAEEGSSEAQREERLRGRGRVGRERVREVERAFEEPATSACPLPCILFFQSTVTGKLRIRAVHSEPASV